MTIRPLVILVFLAILGSMISTVSWANEPMQIMVSILPQRYFVKRIAGDSAIISVIVSPGANPATYEPKPTQMEALVRSRIYFAIGVPFERVWLKKFISVNPGMLVVHTDHSIKKRKMLADYEFGNRHHATKPANPEKGLPEKAFMDPHIWLSPPLVKIQAEIIADALISIDPAGKEVYEANLREFQTELDRLDAEISSIFGGKLTRTEFLVFHPSWGYFAGAYGLKQIPVEIEGNEPRAAQMARLIKYARSKGIKAIFIQPQFPKKTAEVIAREIGARVIVADPLSEDWMENLRKVAAEFKQALQ